MDFKEASLRLRHNIALWHSAVGGYATTRWRLVEDAITALDNAAYDRAYTVAHKRCHAECYEALVTEIEHLTTERDLARTEFKREATDAGRLARERNEARGAAMDWHQTAIDRAQELRRLRQDRDGALKTSLQRSVDLINARRKHDELQRQFDERGRERDGLKAQRDRERDRLKQDLEFTEHRREQAEHEIERLRPLLSAEQQVRMERRVGAEQLEKERDEARVALTGERRAVEWALKGRNAARAELADARETIRMRDDIARDTVKGVQSDYWRLRTALETLADRYHAQLCYKNRRYPHRRGSCPYVLAVQEANAALTGKSESERAGAMAVKVTGGEITIDGVLHDVLPNGCLMPRSSAAASATVRKAALKFSPVSEAQATRMIFDDRKPKEQPEIEAVLMGTEIVCACGCGIVVRRGYCAYRFVKDVLAEATLFVSPEHARKAARPKARTHPPYAAYTDAMREAEREEGWKTLTVPTTPEPEPPTAVECGDCGWRGTTENLALRYLCPVCLHGQRVRCVKDQS